MIPGPGHNKGPTQEAGSSWRKHCWTRARRDLLPHLPIEVLRTRVKRARELGLNYKTYASVRASTGHDVVGFLFSSNALRSFLKAPEIPAARTEKLRRLQRCARIALVSAPLGTGDFARANTAAQIDAIMIAPAHLASWSEARQSILTAISPAKIAPDSVLMIGDTELEQEWSKAGRLAGFLAADRYFADVTA